MTWFWHEVVRMLPLSNPFAYTWLEAELIVILYVIGGVTCLQGACEYEAGQ